jgi:hypothetical protein
LHAPQPDAVIFVGLQTPPIVEAAGKRKFNVHSDIDAGLTPTRVRLEEAKLLVSINFQIIKIHNCKGEVDIRDKRVYLTFERRVKWLLYHGRHHIFVLDPALLAPLRPEWSSIGGIGLMVPDTKCLLSACLCDGCEARTDISFGLNFWK